MNATSSASVQYDLVVRNAALPDGRTAMDIAVRDGRIAAVAPHAELAAAGGATELDAQGQLVTPPFVDAHFHMDATLSFGLPRVNASGTLLEGIALWGELKPLADDGRAGRPGARILRLGGGQGPPRDPLARRRLRPAPAGRRSAAARARARAAVSRPAARRVSAGRPAALGGRARQPHARARQGGGRRRRHSAFRAHDGGRRGVGAHPLRNRGAAGASRRPALRRDGRSGLAAHRDAGAATRGGWACRGAWPART